MRIKSIGRLFLNTLLSLLYLSVIMYPASTAWADSSAYFNENAATPIVAKSVTYTPTLTAAHNYSSLPTCTTPPTNCPTSCASPQANSNPAIPSSCNPSTCPAVCTVTRNPEVPATIPITGSATLMDPNTVVTPAVCPAGYVVVGTFDVQLEIAYGPNANTATITTINPTSSATYSALAAAKAANGSNLFTCGGYGTTYNAGRMNTCGWSGDYPNGSIWGAGTLGNSGNNGGGVLGTTVNQYAAIITQQVGSSTCGCAGSCDNTCSCSVADTPRFVNYYYQYLQCTMNNVPSSGFVYLTGNYAPVAVVCGYVLQ
jgi:hypothetical protein